MRWVSKALTSSKQMLSKDSGWKSSCSFPPRLSSLPAKPVIHCKAKHLLPTHGKTEKPASEDKIGREKIAPVAAASGEQHIIREAENEPEEHQPSGPL